MIKVLEVPKATAKEIFLEWCENVKKEYGISVEKIDEEIEDYKFNSSTLNISAATFFLLGAGSGVAGHTVASVIALSCFAMDLAGIGLGYYCKSKLEKLKKEYSEKYKEYLEKSTEAKEENTYAIEGANVTVEAVPKEAEMSPMTQQDEQQSEADTAMRM